jgi:ribosomal protein L37AE/L43A
MPSMRDLDPLLRDLVHWKLVSFVEDGNGRRWALSDAAQRRLTELRPPYEPTPDRIVYFDRRCHGCERRTMTRLVGDGVHLCSACAQSRVAGGTVQEGPAPLTDGSLHASRRKRHRRRARGREQPPLAS